MNVKILSTALALLLSWMGIAVAQPPVAADAAEARQRGISRFEREAPEIGELLPNLEVIDSQGKPFPLRNLKGSYTVLVFGCLT
jgi:cytochrome oxidase Cu insertion factor (SCO1/SenC/PrrC family)